MSVDLSKCKVGDKVQLRDGTVAKLFENKCRDNEKFPWFHDSGIEGGFIGVDNEGFCCIDWKEQDIVKVLTPHNDRKVAKFTIQGDGAWWFLCKDLNVCSPDTYTSSKSAIRAARRFCEKIGYECEIIK